MRGLLSLDCRLEIPILILFARDARVAGLGAFCGEPSHVALAVRLACRAVLGVKPLVTGVRVRLRLLLDSDAVALHIAEGRLAAANCAGAAMTQTATWSARMQLLVSQHYAMGDAFAGRVSGLVSREHPRARVEIAPEPGRLQFEARWPQKIPRNDRQKQFPRHGEEMTTARSAILFRAIAPPRPAERCQQENRRMYRHALSGRS